MVQIGCTELDETVQRNSAYVAKLKQNGANPMDSRLMVTRHPPPPWGPPNVTSGHFILFCGVKTWIG